MTKKQQKLLISVFTSIILLCLYLFDPARTARPLPPAPPGLYNVLSYADGDTLTVDMNGTEERIRFIGIDTPETKKHDAPAQCYADEAAAFMKKTVESKPVRLEADTVGDNRDRYDRLLRYVYTKDGTLLNKTIIEQGYGFAYTQFKFDRKEEFVQAQRSAFVEKRGLWGTCQITNNNGRYRTNNL